jgi:hypothetical protein
MANYQHQHGSQCIRIPAMHILIILGAAPTNTRLSLNIVLTSSRPEAMIKNKELFLCLLKKDPESEGHEALAKVRLSSA